VTHCVTLQMLQERLQFYRRNKTSSSSSSSAAALAAAFVPAPTDCQCATEGRAGVAGDLICMCQQHEQAMRTRHACTCLHTYIFHEAAVLCISTHAGALPPQAAGVDVLAAAAHVAVHISVHALQLHRQMQYNPGCRVYSITMQPSIHTV
jgi:hypothetical protein